MSNFPCSPTRNITSRTVSRTWLFIAYSTQMKDGCTINSDHLTYTSLLKKDGRMYFLSLGMKGLFFSPSRIRSSLLALLSYLCVFDSHLRSGMTESKEPWKKPRKTTSSSIMTLCPVQTICLWSAGPRLPSRYPCLPPATSRTCSPSWFPSRSTRRCRHTRHARRK